MKKGKVIHASDIEARTTSEVIDEIKHDPGMMEIVRESAAAGGMGVADVLESVALHIVETDTDWP